MEKVKAFLERKDIEISVKRYLIDALGAMAQGLFCSLLIGTIINTVGTQFHIGFLTMTVATIGGVGYTVGGLACAMAGRPEPDFTGRTLLGALARHVTTPSSNFQPMNANFGILDRLPFKVRGKKNRYEKLSETAIDTISEVKKQYEL